MEPGTQFPGPGSVGHDGLDPESDGKYWRHAMRPPSTTFKYKKSKKLTHRLNTTNLRGSFLKPMVVFETIGDQLYKDNDISVYEDDPENTTTGTLFEESEGIKAFSGHISLPKLAMNFPHSNITDENIDKCQSDVANLVYQNDCCQEDLTFIFGGLYTSYDRHRLGLPRNIDFTKVSVHLPVDLPLFIDRTVLMSPYLTANKHIYLFNPERNTVTFLDDFVSDLPSHLCGASVTSISKRHVFIFGGFELKVTNVYYVDDTDRWIIEKDIVVNHHGYVFDTKTFKFLKISLNKKGTSDFQIGRLGHAITANVYEKVSEQDTVSSFRMATPVNSFKESSYYSPYIPINEANEEEIKSLIFTKRSKRDKSFINKNYLHSEPGTPISMSSSNNMFKNHVKKTITGTSVDSNKLQKINSVHSRDSKVDSSGSQKPKGPFHKIRPPSSPIHGNGPFTHRPTLSLTSQPVIAAVCDNHQSSYSSHVKQHRSNSGSLKTSPISPIPQTALRPSFISRIDNDNSDSDEESDDNGSTDPIAYDTTKRLYEMSLSPPRSHTGSKRTLSIYRSKRSSNSVFGDTLIKPTQSLTNIFIFGGFVEWTDHNIKKFKATNDFLRIDLICDGEYFVTNLQSQADIYKIHDIDNLPCPRGYFASCLVGYDMPTDDYCNWVYDMESSRPFSPSSFEEESSISSIQTSNSRNHKRTFKVLQPDEFFQAKAFLIQGGCNESYQALSDLYIFKFGSLEWEKIDTYTYDYFDQQHNKTPEFKLYKQVEDPSLVEAELTACHHKAIYYNRFGKELVFFIGGFRKDFLEHFNQVISDKIDPFSLSKFKLSANNFDDCRVLVLNVKTQTFGYIKYYSDFRKNISRESFERLKDKPLFHNANVAFHGNSVSLNGRILTIYQGLVTHVPENHDDFDVNKGNSGFSSLLGAHFQLTFPSI